MPSESKKGSTGAEKNDPRQEDIPESSRPATTGDDSEAQLLLAELRQWGESRRAIERSLKRIIELKQKTSEESERRIHGLEEGLKEAKQAMERIPPGEERTKQEQVYERCCSQVEDLRKWGK
ncbi:hypothetical protein MGN70_011881 [Eutypa lata]|nr:hypothetical protein MGN70_011881 [Eutypa lata]